jgi:hypothetical protein
MIIPANKVIRIINPNPQRCYLAIQNANSTATNYLYILQEEALKEVFLDSGLKIGGYGLFEMQNCMSAQAKKAFYAYTTVVGGLDVRILEA